jgi:hypothetical protein
VTYTKSRLHKVGYFADLMATNEEIDDCIRPLLRLSREHIDRAQKLDYGLVSSTSYCAGLVVGADRLNHLAVPVQRIDAQPHDAGHIDGPYFLASYTSDSSGNLTTTTNYTNMPRLSIAENLDVNDVSISPDNRYVAVAADGFQVLRFNGSNPPTNFSGALLTGQYVGSFGWDRAHHLYAIALKYSNGTYTSFLHIYNVTSAGVREVSGSPHYLANLSGLTVLSLQ